MTYQQTSNFEVEEIDANKCHENRMLQNTKRATLAQTRAIDRFVLDQKTAQDTPDDDKEHLWTRFLFDMGTNAHGVHVYAQH